MVRFTFSVKKKVDAIYTGCKQKQMLFVPSILFVFTSANSDRIACSRLLLSSHYGVNRYRLICCLILTPGLDNGWVESVSYLHSNEVYHQVCCHVVHVTFLIAGLEGSITVVCDQTMKLCIKQRLLGGFSFMYQLILEI